MRDLPNAPSFPVFGLGEGFRDLRWLIMWNDLDRLYTVTLGHGDPDAGPWIAVETIAKTPQRPTGPDSAAGPTGLGDAAMGAAIYLVETNHPMRAGRSRDPARRMADMNEEMAHLDHRFPSDAVEFDQAWDQVVVNLDGTDVNARCRERGIAGAIVLDLPAVAVAIRGPSSMLASRVDLMDVTDRLDWYV